LARLKRRNADRRGFSAVELLFATALMVTVGGIALPPLLSLVEEARAQGAARHVAARLQRARVEAILRSADVAVRFTASGTDYSFATYVDGNGDGVLTADIKNGIDTRIGSIERLADGFSGVTFGTIAGLPPVDPGGTAPGSDPIRLGSSNGATFTASGTASSGSIYVRGSTTRQFVVRIYGDTARTRILRFDGRSKTWKPL
jgi:Tfp pilus assembly protein FimT